MRSQKPTELPDGPLLHFIGSAPVFAAAVVLRAAGSLLCAKQGYCDLAGRAARAELVVVCGGYSAVVLRHHFGGGSHFTALSLILSFVTFSGSADSITSTTRKRAITPYIPSKRSRCGSPAV